MLDSTVVRCEAVTVREVVEVTREDGIYCLANNTLVVKTSFQTGSLEAEMGRYIWLELARTPANTARAARDFIPR